MRNRLKSFRFAFNGLKVFFGTQPNARIHLVISIVTIILGFLLKVNMSEWLWLAFSIAIVFITEIINTAIEFLTNIVSPHYSKHAGKVKDISAAAVLLASILAFIVGLMVFVPKIGFLF